MVIEDRRVSLAYKLASATVCCWGLYLNSGLPEGMLDTETLVFFTLLANLLCFIYFVLSSICCARDIKKTGAGGTTTVLPRFKGAVVMAALIAFLVYQFLLMPAHSLINIETTPRVSNVLVHYVVPFLILGDWLLFDKKGIFRRYDPLFWGIVPLTYLFYCIIRAKFGGLLNGINSRYPYFYIDIDELGGVQVLINIVMFMLFFLGISYLFVWLDMALGQSRCKSRNR